MRSCESGDGKGRRSCLFGELPAACKGRWAKILGLRAFRQTLLPPSRAARPGESRPSVPRPKSTICHNASGKIGRASCRERVCQYVSISVVAVSLKKKTKKDT